MFEERIEELSMRVRILAAIALGVTCAGCDQIQTLFGSAPSTKTFSDCVEAGKKEGMDVKTTKNFCINKYQGRITDDGAIKGTASPEDCVPEDDVGWKNKETNKISKDIKDLMKVGVYNSIADFEVVVLNKAEPRTCDRYEFKIRNASKEYVVTSVEFVIKNLRTGKSENHILEDQWIEPSKEASFKVKLENPFLQANYDDKLKDQHSWYKQTIKGFKINY